MATRVKGRATMRTAALFLMASAVLEIMDFNSAVAFLGGVRTGGAAVVYHFIFMVLYFLSGIGLWTGRPWGYRAVMTTTAVYTIDKVQLVLFPEAFYDYIMEQLTVTREVVGMIPRDQLVRYFMIVYGVLVLCWWGLALYIHARRRYFQEENAPAE